MGQAKSSSILFGLDGEAILVSHFKQNEATESVLYKLNGVKGTLVVQVIITAPAPLLRVSVANNQVLVTVHRVVKLPTEIGNREAEHHHQTSDVKPARTTQPSTNTYIRQLNLHLDCYFITLDTDIS